MDRGQTDGLSRAECERRTLVGGRKVYENGMGGVGDEVEGCGGTKKQEEERGGSSQQG